MIRRDVLKRKAQKGLLMARQIDYSGLHQYTWFPANEIDDDEFRTKSGCAWETEKGYRMFVHSNLCYELEDVK